MEGNDRKKLSTSIDEHRRLSIQAIFLYLKLRALQKTLIDVDKKIDDKEKDIHSVAKKIGMKMKSISVSSVLTGEFKESEKIPGDVMKRYPVFRTLNGVL